MISRAFLYWTSIDHLPEFMVYALCSPTITFQAVVALIQMEVFLWHPDDQIAIFGADRAIAAEHRRGGRRHERRQIEPEFDRFTVARPFVRGFPSLAFDHCQDALSNTAMCMVRIAKLMAPMASMAAGTQYLKTMDTSSLLK